MSSTCRGVDTSHWVVVRSYTELKQGGVTFDFHKASEGGDYQDPTFGDHRRRAMLAGVVFGGYHFLRAEWTGLEQADQYLRTVSDPRGIMHAVDVERRHFRDGSFSDPSWMVLEGYMEAMRSALGRYPIVYVNLNYWTNVYGGRPWPPGWPLWVARWSDTPGMLPDDRRRALRFWQRDNARVVAGIDRPCDDDTFLGEAEDLTREFVL
jgi:lysozyme